MQGRADLKAGFVVAGLFGHARRRQGGGWCGPGGRQGLHVRLDRAVTGRQLGLTRVKEFEILLEDKQVLGPIVPRQGGEDLRL